MPLNRPSLTELVDRVSSDLMSRLGFAGVAIRRSVEGVLARVYAGAIHGLYGFAEYISKQCVPITSEAEFLYNWAITFGVQRFPATFAAGTNCVTATGANGSIIPVDTVLRRSDGALFKTTEEAEIASGTASLSVVATIAGESANTAYGVALSFLSPVAGVNTGAVVAGDGITGGSDQETDESLKARLIQKIQYPPQGGSADDYITWAKSVPGVTRAWVDPLWDGPGTVKVIFVRDNDESGIIPGDAEIDEVEAYIAARRPVTADVTVAAPIAVVRDLDISITPNNSTIRASVEAEIRDLFIRIAEPGGTIPLSKIREAVSSAHGVIDSDVTDPAANIEDDPGEMSIVGPFTFTTL